MGDAGCEDEIGDERWCAAQGVELGVGVDERGEGVGGLGADVAGGEAGAEDVEFDEGAEEEENCVVVVHASLLSMVGFVIRWELTGQRVRRE